MPLDVVPSRRVRSRARLILFMACAAFAAGCLLLAPAVCQAKFYTPEKLLEYLNSGDPTKYNQAYGYIVGVYDSFEGVIYTHNHEVDEEKLVHEVEKYLKNHADKTYFSAQLAVLDALKHYRDKLDAQEKARKQGG